MFTSTAFVVGVVGGVVFKSWIMQLAKKVITLAKELADWAEE